MAAKKVFVGPRILTDSVLEEPDRNFPLMPLAAISGALPSDPTNDLGADFGFDPQPKVDLD